MIKTFQKILIPALCMLPLTGLAQNGKVQLSDESKLSINGTSNVTDFRCNSEHHLEQDTLSYDYHYTGNVINVDGVTLNLEIDQFDCGKRGINRDFKSTLKYKKHPFIQLTLNELVMADSSDLAPQHARVTIEIAEVQREYVVPLLAFSSSEKQIVVEGRKTLYMSDFGLKPPSPLFGLIQVSDELEIDFQLVIIL